VAKLEDVCPSYVGARLIDLQLVKALETPLARLPVLIRIATLEEASTIGLMLPLELRVTAPSPSGFIRHVFTRIVPTQFAITPREGGNHLVSLRELAHNRWCGSLVIAVRGDALTLADA